MNITTSARLRQQLVGMCVDAHPACARAGYHPCWPGSAPDFMSVCGLRFDKHRRGDADGCANGRRPADPPLTIVPRRA
jgi:hypothetical protein